MAADAFTVSTVDSGVHNTLSTTTADTITVTTAVPARLQVIPRSGAGIWVRTDGTTAVALTDANRFIPAGMLWEWSVSAGTVTVVSVVGSSNDYSVQGQPVGTYS